MNTTESQFETGRKDRHRQEFHRSGNYRNDSFGYSRRQKKFEFIDSVETTESDHRFVFRIPLSLISIENYKVIPEKNYIIIQSNKKTIFINLDPSIQLGKLVKTFKADMLIIEVKKLKPD